MENWKELIIVKNIKKIKLKYFYENKKYSQMEK